MTTTQTRTTITLDVTGLDDCDQATLLGHINHAMRRDPATTEFLHHRNLTDGIPATTTGVYGEPFHTTVAARINPDDVAAVTITNYQMPAVARTLDEYRIMGLPVFTDPAQTPQEQARTAREQAIRLLALARHLDPTSLDNYR